MKPGWKWEKVEGKSHLKKDGETIAIVGVLAGRWTGYFVERRQTIPFYAEEYQAKRVIAKRAGAL